MSSLFDPQPASPPPSHLSTSQLAGAKAASICGSRRARILQFLAEAPSTIFEIAARMELHDHQISGRFGELEREALIEKTGHRRPKPETGCLAEVYRVAAPVQRIDKGIVAHYPDVLNLGDDGIFERQPFITGDPTPGVPYIRRADAGGARAAYWIALVECGACGRPLKLVVDGKQKSYRCGTPGCKRTWYLQIVSEPGVGVQGQMLALVIKHL